MINKVKILNKMKNYNKSKLVKPDIRIICKLLGLLDLKESKKRWHITTEIKLNHGRGLRYIRFCKEMGWLKITRDKKCRITELGLVNYKILRKMVK